MEGKEGKKTLKEDEDDDGLRLMELKNGHGERKQMNGSHQ